MGQYTVELLAEEEKALLAYTARQSGVPAIQEWLSISIHDKARRCIDAVVAEHSEYNPGRISKARKLQIVRDATVRTVAETVPKAGGGTAPDTVALGEGRA